MRCRRRVQWLAFRVPPERIAEDKAAIVQECATRIVHAVWIDGEIVGSGSCAPTPYGLALFGGATLPDRRGRGAYRALIAARWREAQNRGLPALLTQGGSMSAPILRRIGFVPVGRVQMLVDQF